MAFQIHLGNFSGPLDLLLHLIKSNKMDICDIRVFEVTEQYLAVIERMKQLDLDVAGEFLLMAATLVHIKSRMLLPVNEEMIEEEGKDPRAELVKRLLEYQRYKEVAELFQQLPQLERDVFIGHFRVSALLEVDTEEEIEVGDGIYHLADAFHRLLNERPKEIFHEVIRESLSVVEYIDRITEKLLNKKRLAFRELFPVDVFRDELIVTFLALLELVKMCLVNVEQVEEFSEIWLVIAVLPDRLSLNYPENDLLDYG
jgi:segregation and condensation protein A